MDRQTGTTTYLVGNYIGRNRKMGLFYEEFEVGHVYRTPARTVTEADIVAFAGLSGDYNPLHTDEAYAAATPFKTRVAHGPLGLAILTGLSARTGLFDGTTLAMLGMNWRFTGPIFPGDTIHGEMMIKAKRETSKPGRGIVERDIKLVNQRGEVVQAGVFTVMVRCRPEAPNTNQQPHGEALDR